MLPPDAEGAARGACAHSPSPFGAGCPHARGRASAPGGELSAEDSSPGAGYGNGSYRFPGPAPAAPGPGAMTFPSRSSGRGAVQAGARRAPAGIAATSAFAASSEAAAPVPDGARGAEASPRSARPAALTSARPLAGRSRAAAQPASRRRRRPPSVQPQPLDARSRKRKAARLSRAGAAPPRGRQRVWPEGAGLAAEPGTQGLASRLLEGRGLLRRAVLGGGSAGRGPPQPGN